MIYGVFESKVSMVCLNQKVTKGSKNPIAYLQPDTGRVLGCLKVQTGVCLAYSASQVESQVAKLFLMLACLTQLSENGGCWRFVCSPATSEKVSQKTGPSSCK